MTINTGEKLTYANDEKIKWNNETKKLDIGPYHEPVLYTVTMYVRNTQGTAKHEFTLTVAAAADGIAAHFLNLTPGADASSLMVSWISDSAGSTDSVAHVAEKSAMTDIKFPSSAVEFIVATGPAGATESWHKATITGLKFDTDYIYRVADSKGGKFSKIYNFHTGAEGDFEFIALSDAQINGKDNATNGWTNTVAAFSRAHSDTRLS